MSDARTDLLALQQQQREAHLAGDAERMVAMFADDFVSVQDGVIRQPTRTVWRARFERYFAMVTFHAWDDIAEPVIQLSTDETLASVLVHKRVHLTYPDEAGQETTEETVFAWAETWRRVAARWELAMVVSTRTP